MIFKEFINIGDIVLLDGVVAENFFDDDDDDDIGILNNEIVAVINYCDYNGDVTCEYTLDVDNNQYNINMRITKCDEGAIQEAIYDQVCIECVSHCFDEFEDYLTDHHIDELYNEKNIDLFSRIGVALYNTISNAMSVGKLAITQFESRTKNARSQ